MGAAKPDRDAMPASIHEETLPPFPGLRPEAFRFLSELVENNRREWFNERKQIYTDEVQWPLRCLAVDVARKLSHTGLRLLADPKKALFRIYRDTRFSNNKDPYKTAQGVVLSPDGDHRTPGALYVHFEPGSCFVAAGFWMPEPDFLRAWRTAMVADPDLFLSSAHDLRERGLELDREDPLKRLPRGFETPPDEELNPYLLLRSFTVSRTVEDSALERGDFTDQVAAFALDARPLLEFGWGIG